MVIITGIFPWTLWLIQSLTTAIKKIRYNDEQVTGFIIIWVALITLFFSIPASKIDSYLLPIFPALALLIGRYAAEKELSEKYWSWLWCGFSVLIVVASVVLAFLPNQLFQHYNLTYHAQILNALFFGLIGSFGFFLFLLGRVPQRWLSIVIFATVCLLGVSFLQTTMHFKTTIKPIANIINPLLQPGDEVVTYESYYYDLPFYIHKKIIVVTDWDNPTTIQNDSWRGQMASLLQYQPQAREWLITDNQFWQQLFSKKRLYVILSKNKFPSFEITAQPSTVYILGKYGRNYLVTNQPTSNAS
ncbi:MAG: hypothetical protein ACK4PR_05785, partial [Gammaproteobacteria bacterium]